MALQRTKLADIQYVASSAGVLLENTNGTDKILVAGFTIFNGNTTAELVKLYYVPDSGGAAGTAGVSNQFFEVSVQPKETIEYELAFGMMLNDDGDSIQGVTTTASKVTIVLHGDKIT